jgi:hypothetical protein
VGREVPRVSDESFSACHHSVTDIIAPKYTQKLWKMYRTARLCPKCVPSSVHKKCKKREVVELIVDEMETQVWAAGMYGRTVVSRPERGRPYIPTSHQHPGAIRHIPSTVTIN